MAAGEDATMTRANEPEAGAQVRELLAERTSTNAGEWHLVFKARLGMKAAFDVLAERAKASEATCADAFAAAGEASHNGGIGAAADPSATVSPKNEVVTQLFTCCTAVDPITAAGLVPVFGDIDPDTLALSVDGLPVGEKTCAVMLQHTCGLMSAKDAALAEAARRAGALVLEDCAHCVGRMATGADGKPLADLSFHSFGVEKMLPTHFGGAVWVSPEFAKTEVGALVTAKLEGLPQIDARLAKAARSYLNQMRLLNHMPANLAHGLRKRLTETGKLEPAVAPCELAGAVSGEPAVPDAWVCETALGAFRGLDANEQVRSAAVAAYADALRDVPGVTVPAAALAADAGPLLRFPVFVGSTELAETVIADVCRAGYYAVAWYRKPLFPGVTDEAAFGLGEGYGCWPATMRACEGAVSLPTDVTPDEARSIAATVVGVAG